MDIFRDIKPVFECEPGGSKYKSIIEGVLSEIDFPKGDAIRFGSDINYDELIKSTLQGIKSNNTKLKDVKRNG